MLNFQFLFKHVEKQMAIDVLGNIRKLIFLIKDFSLNENEVTYVCSILSFYNTFIYKIKL